MSTWNVLAHHHLDILLAEFIQLFTQQGGKLSPYWQIPEEDIIIKVTSTLQFFQFQFRTGIRNTFVDQIQVNLILGHTANCWFSLDVTKIQTTKLSILPRFYFHDVSEQLKTNFHTSFRFKRVLGFATEYAWISKLLRDTAFTWRPRELSCRLTEDDLFQGILLSKQFY